MPWLSRAAADSISTGNSSNSNSDAQSAEEEDLVPEPAVMRQLRATLIEGRAAPEFQRLLLERQARTPWKFGSVSSGRPCTAMQASAQTTDGGTKTAPSKTAKATSDKSKRAVDDISVEFKVVNESTRNQGGPAARVANMASEAMEETDESEEFWDWLRTALLRQMLPLSCLTSDRADKGKPSALWSCEGSIAGAEL